MKYVKIKGGLGNQMFQYAFAKFLERELGEEVLLDFHQYEKLRNDPIRKPRLLKFQISLQAAEAKKCGLILPHIGKSTSFLYKAGVYAETKLNKKYHFTKGLVYEKPTELAKWDYFDGYWQSHKYVDEVRDILINEFQPNYALSPSTIEAIEEFSATNTVFVGVRKGDYTKNASMRASWGEFNDRYYCACMKYLSSKIAKPRFVVFSNDIEWCKMNLKFEGFDYVYREPQVGVDDFEELQIMAACRHAIIVNSTFNWWGAWLNSRPDKIVCCPRNWYFNGQSTEILPEKWVRFDTDGTMMD